jgi:L-malate glycosyltransferase
MKKLKILFLQTFPLYGSGSGTYVRYLAKELNKTHKVALLVPDNRPVNGVQIYNLKMPFNVSFTGHPEWKNSKLFTELTNREILQIHKSFMTQTLDAVEDFKPDIIHVQHAFPFTWSSRFIKSTIGIKYVVTIHGSELPTASRDRRYIALTTDALRKSSRIIPNSYYTRDWMYKVFGDEYKHQIKVIPGGVDIEKFKRVGTADLDKKYGLKGKRVVVFAGKLTKYKGVKYLIMAAKKINGEVIILGDGPDKKYLEGLAKKENLKNIRFLGHFGDDTKMLIKFYSRADVFVAPSVWDEPLGLVILEAMACETPVVVTRKGGIPLAVKDGKNGYFVKPRNAKDIVEKVNMLLKNDEMRRKMGKTARKIAEKKFSWKVISERFSRIYIKEVR